jgi:hypothetical protein
VRPKAIVEQWVDAFNAGDARRLAAFYALDAVNHQGAEAPVVGRAAIHARFEQEFAMADMTCVVETLFEDGDWAILEGRDPLGLRGCGFFHVLHGRMSSSGATGTSSRFSDSTGSRRLRRDISAGPVGGCTNARRPGRASSRGVRVSSGSGLSPGAG